MRAGESVSNRETKPQIASATKLKSPIKYKVDNKNIDKERAKLQKFRVMMKE